MQPLTVKAVIFASGSKSIHPREATCCPSRYMECFRAESDVL